MTKLIHREGNIFDTDAMAIGHGVNAKGVMGAGIALQFKNRFPEMYETYKTACAAGTVTGGQSYGWKLEDGRYIFNIVSQIEPGANASYDLLFRGVQRTLEAMVWLQFDTLALPRIGSGIGGLDEDIVETALATIAFKSPINIELWTYKA